MSQAFNPNFKPLTVDAEFPPLAGYAHAVAHELTEALDGLVEEVAAD